MLYSVRAPQASLRSMWEASRQANNSPPPRVISGRSLVHRKLSAPQKAAIAARLLAGEAIIQLSTTQLRQFLGVSVSYIRAASQLTPAKREAIANGTDKTSFTILMPSSKKQAALPRPITDDTDITDVQLANIIRSVGVDRALAVACKVENTTA